MTQQEKDKVMEQVLNDFDFVKVACLRMLTNPEEPYLAELARLRSSAEKLLRMALDHEDEDFWWAGGIGHGGFCAWWDKKRGLSLNYIFTASKAKPISNN